MPDTHDASPAEDPSGARLRSRGQGGHTIRLQNGGDVQRARIGSRLGAAFVDLLVAAAAFLAVCLIAGLFHIPHLIGYGHDWGIGYPDHEWLTSLKRALGAAGVAIVAAAACFESWMTLRRGQTIGQRTQGIATVLAGSAGSGHAPDMIGLLVRALVPYGISAAGFFAIAAAGFAYPIRLGLIIGAQLWLLVHLSGLVTRNGRCLHDIMAGTVTIRVRPR